MTTHTLEAMLSHSAAVTQWEQNVGNKGVDQAFAVMSATTNPPGRRSEARMDYRHMCSYEMLEAIEGNSVVIGQGEAFALNEPEHGRDTPPHGPSPSREPVDRSAHPPIRMEPDRERL